MPRPDIGGAGPRRAHLDGIRALAVYLVVAFHADIGGWSGGFIGVDVFFVLSGYLITGLLVGEYDATGRIALRDFYSRRVRRLLPASTITIAVVVVSMASILSPLLVRSFVSDARAALLFVSNWRFISSSTDYFGASAEESPFLHFWSLAVEEQFYAVWPVTLVLVLGLSRRLRQTWITPAFISIVLVGSWLLAWTWRTDLGTRAYFGTDARAYQLAAGGLLVLGVHRFRSSIDALRPAIRNGIAIVALGSILLLATDSLELDSIERGSAVTIAVVALIVAIDSSKSTGTARILGARPLPYLGRISYATYLWHWPIIVYARAEADIGPLGLLALSSIGATAIAALSAVLVERPIRSRSSLERRPRSVVAVALALVVALAVAAPVVAGDPIADAAERATTSDIPSVESIEDAIQEAPTALVGRTSCRVDEVSACIVTDGGSDSFHILLLGDSLSGQWQPALSAVSKSQRITVSAVADQSCMWERGLRFDPEVLNDVGRERDVRCRAQKDDWYDTIIPSLDPDLILIQTRPRAGSDVLAEADDLSDVPRDRLPAVAAARSIEQLREIAPVVALEPMPIIPLDVPRCLVKAERADDCAFDRVDDEYGESDVLEAISEAGAAVLSPLPLVCPRIDVCDPVVDGLIVFRDTIHITVQYSAAIGDDLVRLLQSNDLIPD